MKPENLPETSLDPSLPTKLGQQQIQFAAHIRDPDNQPLPERVEDRRMAIYRNLFYNNIENFITGNFPVIRKLFKQEDWHQLVRGFYRDYRCKTPLFTEIAEEFIYYLQQHKPCPEKPFLCELAHYEWTELALDLDDKTIDMDLVDPDGDLNIGVPAFSPQAWVLSYNWPVDKISPDYQPANIPDQASYFLVRRLTDESIKFTRLNQVSARLCELLSSDESLTGDEALQKITSELGRKDDLAIITAGQKLMLDFRQQEIILGTRIF